MDGDGGLDPMTLRPTLTKEQAEARLHELGPARSVPALLERTDLLRQAGRFAEAGRIASEAVRASRFDGDRERFVLARISRALVTLASGRGEQAAVELGVCATEAESAGWTETQAGALHAKGVALLGVGEVRGALESLREALTVRVREHAPAEVIDGTMLQIAAAEARLPRR